MDTTTGAQNMKHDIGSDLGSILDVAKEDWKDWLMFGAGAAAGITGTDLALSKLTKSDGTPWVPTSMSPIAVAGLGIVGGELVRRYLSKDIGWGMIAGTVGVAISALVAKYTAPAVAATAQDASGAPAATAGFGFGRAYSNSISGAFAGLGRYDNTRPSIPYAVGSDTSAMGMFGAAPVRIEAGKSRMHGSTVQYQDTSNGGAMQGTTLQLEDTTHGGAMAGFMS